MTIEWNDDLKIGVEKIDQQHKMFFEQRDKFLEACSELIVEKGDSPQAREEIEDLFYFLTDYFVTHFNDEEELQQKFEYPNYEQHKQRHRKFIERINKIKYDFLNRDEIDLDLVKKLNRQITKWFINHIGDEDREISEYITD